MIAWLHDVASHLTTLAAVPWAVRDHEHRPGEAWMLRRLRIDGVGPRERRPAAGRHDALARARIVVREDRDAATEEEEVKGFV